MRTHAPNRSRTGSVGWAKACRLRVAVPDLSVVDVAFRDLADAHGHLATRGASPKEVRRGFASFVDLSQKLTSHMRKEYSERTGEKWYASEFAGWNDVTDLFKQLRNDDQHDRPVTIVVHERQYLQLFEDAPEVVMQGTWSFSLEDQLGDEPRDDLHMHLADPETGQPSEHRILPARKEYEFRLHTSSEKACALLAKVGDDDVRTLSHKCFEVLTEYYRYYQRRLTQSGE